MNTEARMEVANAALGTFGKNFFFSIKGDHLNLNYVGKGTVESPAITKLARIREQGDWMFWRRWPCGGTQNQALAQLVRYIRDIPRLPLCTWEYWASDTIALCSKETVGILAAGEYGDPKRTCCVLCGLHDYGKSGLDWWSLDGVNGPVCGWRGGCRQQGKAGGAR